MAKAQHALGYRVLPEMLRRVREEAGLTQRELGERLGKPQSWVYNCESANRRVDVTEFIAWCRRCGTAPAKWFNLIEGAIRQGRWAKDVGTTICLHSCAFVPIRGSPRSFACRRARVEYIEAFGDVALFVCRAAAFTPPPSPAPRSSARLSFARFPSAFPCAGGCSPA